MRRNKKAKESTKLDGLTPGIRMKGGVRFSQVDKGFIAIVHTWDNVHCHGEPQEWRHPKIFLTEDTAMQFYKTSIRPSLQQMMAEMADKHSAKTLHRKLEE